MNDQTSNFGAEEDYALSKLIRMFGIKKWKIITLYFNKFFPDSNRNAKSLKDR
jgi:hypothetical protein